MCIYARRAKSRANYRLCRAACARGSVLLATLAPATFHPYRRMTNDCPLGRFRGHSAPRALGLVVVEGIKGRIREGKKINPRCRDFESDRWKVFSLLNARRGRRRILVLMNMYRISLWNWISNPRPHCTEFIIKDSALFKVKTSGRGWFFLFGFLKLKAPRKTRGYLKSWKITY